MTCSAGPFLSIEHGEDVSVLVQPAGFGAEQVAYARSMAAQLTAAADEIETKLGAAANV